MADARLIIRPVRRGELAEAGRIVAASYFALPDFPHDPTGYDLEIADVAARLDDTEVVVAELEGRLVGCLTYVGDPNSPFAEHQHPDAATFRYFGVDPSAQGAGVGRSLVQWAVERARAEAKSKLHIHTLESMTTAQALYERFGFVRDPAADADWDGVKGVAYVLDLWRE
ncbi:MAG: GNAT family N-acetyltransferase [Actinomycetota bacterium]|nr:GNAT family N-acetyltransferase [Actinomycetota bacterium]